MDSKLALRLGLPSEVCDLDLRDAFFDELNRIAKEDRNILLLTDDQDAFSLSWLRENLPSQYLNAGIAEQNLISVACGLALAGKTPIVYGISTFMTMRCYEQIRDDLCCMDLPVTIVASGGGFGYSADGPTHHGTQDVALMRSLPNMSVFSPSDAISTIDAAKSACIKPGPKYIRIEKGVKGKIYNDTHDFGSGMAVLASGTDLLIVTTGIMTHSALEIAYELREQGIDAGVVDIYRLKPVIPETFLESINSVNCVVTLEEHSVIGGLGSSVSEIITDQGIPVALKRLGIEDKFNYSYGSREYVYSQVGLDNAAVSRSILQWFRNLGFKDNL